MDTTDIPAQFVYEIGVLPENRRVGELLAQHGVRPDWCSYRAFRDGRHPVTAIGPDTLVAGSVQFVHHGLETLGVPVPAPLGFPDELQPWLGRNVTATTADKAIAVAAGRRIFVKPASELKRFTGGLTNDLAVIDALNAAPDDLPVWMSDPIELLAEWRCFVIGDEIVGIEQYLPEIETLWPTPPRQTLEPIAAAAAACIGRAAFSLDVGYTPHGDIVIVELNDAYALGSYGLEPSTYLSLLWARWRQLVAGAHQTHTPRIDQ